MTSLHKGWYNGKIGDLLTGIKAGKNLRCIETPPRSDERGVVKVSAVTWGEFNPRESKTLPSDFTPDPDTLIRSGNFLFSRANTIELVGSVVIVETAPDNLFLSDKILRLDLPEDWKGWLLSFLRSADGRKALEEASSGNQQSMRNIGQAALKEITIPLPPAAEQKRIVAKLDSLSARSARARTDLDAIPRLIARYKQAVLGSLVDDQDLKRFCLSDLISTLDQGWSPRCEARSVEDDSEWGVLKTTSIQAFRFFAEYNKKLPNV